MWRVAAQQENRLAEIRVALAAADPTAGNLGFHAYVVADATATFDQIGIDGSARFASDVHFAALSDLNGEFATIIQTKTLLDAVLGPETMG